MCFDVRLDVCFWDTRFDVRAERSPRDRRAHAESPDRGGRFEMPSAMPMHGSYAGTLRFRLVLSRATRERIPSALALCAELDPAREDAAQHVGDLAT